MAAFVLHIPVLLLLLVTEVGGAVGREAERQAPAIGLFIALVVPAVISVLIFLEDASGNSELTPPERKRWLMAIAAMPYSLAFYWWRHRGARSAAP